MIMLKPRFQKHCLMAALVLMFAANSHAAEEVPDATDTTQQVAALINQLSSDDYQIRRQATEKLPQFRQAAIEPLMDLAHEEDLEAAVRAVSILEKMYQSGDKETVDAVETALLWLLESPNRSAAIRANDALKGNYGIRRARAIEEIIKMGGVLKVEPDKALDPKDINNFRQAIPVLHLGEKWTGGDAGLKQVARMSELKYIYFIENVNEVTREGLLGLQAALPDLTLVYRGAAQLGVQPMPDPRMRGCHIAVVTRGSAADVGGIRERDHIVSFDDKPVEDFEQLVEYIRAKKPGDKVVIRVNREGRTLSLDIVLKGWDRAVKPARARE